MDIQLRGRGDVRSPPSPGGRRRRRRILVVDDEYLIAQDLAEAIGEAGCDVVGPAIGLKDALRLLRQGRTDAAVIDLNLGKGDEGVLLAEKLTEELCPFVVFSGDDTACARFSSRFPGAHLVRKPAPRHQIRNAIAKLSQGMAD